MALSIFRHHGHSGSYQNRLIKFTDHHDVEVVGESDEVVESVDAVKVLKSELPSHEVGEILLSLDDNISYELSREIGDDGYVRMIQVTRC